MILAGRLPREHGLGYQALACFPVSWGPALIFYTLFEIVGYLVSIVVMLVIVQFVLSLLISFNVVNMHNQFVSAIWTAVNALLEPILAPIRRIMPNTGAIDFSPLVLIIGLEILRIILKNMAAATM
jgi:YggT family protein